METQHAIHHGQDGHDGEAQIEVMEHRLNHSRSAGAGRPATWAPAAASDSRGPCRPVRALALSVHVVSAEALDHACNRGATHHVEPVPGAPRRQDVRSDGAS
jgi:hypothetical protein